MVCLLDRGGAGQPAVFGESTDLRIDGSGGQIVEGDPEKEERAARGEHARRVGAGPGALEAATGVAERTAGGAVQSQVERDAAPEGDHVLERGEGEGAGDRGGRRGTGAAGERGDQRGGGGETAADERQGEQRVLHGGVDRGHRADEGAVVGPGQARHHSAGEGGEEARRQAVGDERGEQERHEEGVGHGCVSGGWRRWTVCGGRGVCPCERTLT
ncbi:hypothetical protein [Rathayibacter festucae]|uniref:hypothetical protein n=1 Tax=Rathayibacter festucae TaxID=110937 RepID=UPI002A69F807|nr:hypothetical protein [Rathayibacter festucae]MDY0914180.1 hypothetical protein [Rathayibacter festucae]